MKKIFFFIFITLCFCSNLSAQIDYYHYYYYYSKDNPFYQELNPHRPTADSVYSRRHNNIHIKSESTRHYRYDKSNLSDTLYYNFLSYEVWNYNLNGLLESYKISSIVSENPSEERLYNYDKEGRIIEYRSENKKTEYIYNKDNAISIRYSYSEIQQKWIPSVKKFYQYTDKGYNLKEYYYDFEKEEYEERPYVFKYIFDSKSRLINIIHVSSDTETLYDVYEYFNDGFIRITYSDDNLYSKEIFTFNERNDLIKYERYAYSTGDKRWYLDHIVDYIYYYPETTSNQTIKSLDFEVNNIDDGISIQTDREKYFYIFNIQGKLVKKMWVHNYAYISLSHGLYIIKSENISKKILVHN